jgi:hypothetical protein
VKIAATVWASYRLLFANFGAFSSSALLWVLLAALPVLFANLTLPIERPDDDQMALVNMAPGLLTMIVSIAASICVAIVWHRFVILGERAGRLLPASMEVVGPFVVRVLAASVPLGIWVIFVATVLADDETIALTVAIYAGASILFALSARFLLILPASATGDRVTTARMSWRVTAGQGFALCVGLLACDLPWIAAGIAIDYVTFDYEINSLESAGAFAVTQFLDLARNAIWTTFLSFAYLEFVRPVQAQADHFS